MAFSDPIVGTEVLIRNQMQSENFSVDPVAGVTGWQLKRDGTATFNNLVIGGPGYTINDSGDAVFHSITLTAQPNETGIILHGDDIDPELYNNKAKGVITKVLLTGASTPYNGTQILFGKLIIPDFNSTRQYRIGVQNIHFDEQSMATPPRRINTFVYLKWDADATTSDTLLHQHQEKVPNDTSDFDQDIEWSFLYQNLSPGGTDAHLSFFFSCDSNDASGLRVQGSSGTGSSASQAPAAALVVEDAGYSFATLPTYDMGTGTSPTTTYTKTYGAQWSESYQEDGTSRGSFDNGDVYQGYFSSTNGNQFSMIGFPYSTIASDLSGSTINKVEVYLDNTHWYNNSGGTAVIGYHNNASAPSPATYPSSTDNITQSSFTYGQAKWVTVANSIGNAFRDGTAKGILLGKGPSTSHTYYGYFVGANKTGEPQLRITYTK